MRLNAMAAPALLVVALFACSIGDPAKSATPAAEEFHKQFNAKQFDAIYQGSDDLLKKSVTKAEFIDAMNRITDKLGAIKSSKQTDSKTETVGSDTIIRVYYDVSWENGDGTEVFTFKAEGAHVNLVHYKIDSPLLN